MATSTSSDSETRPDRNQSISQLLHATKSKLQDTVSGRIIDSVDKSGVDALERDALEVLSLVRSVKNSFAPINRIPTEVLSLIPNYIDDEDDADEGLIALTHVSRGWRNMFVSCSSLWTRLDCMDVDKTRTYIQRSESSPLEIFLKEDEDEDEDYLDDAFALVIPHIHRTKSLTIHANVLPTAVEYFSCRAPLLEKLHIHIRYSGAFIPNDTLFDQDPSSLRELSWPGVETHLPWKNLANLTSFDLDVFFPGRDFVSRLLGLFENAPLLRTIKLEDAIPEPFDAPSGRVVSLPHLRTLSIEADPPHSILLNHLCIPTGASVILRPGCDGDNFPLRDLLPETIGNLRNLSHVTTINLRFGTTEKIVRMEGPSGQLLAFGRWKDGAIPTYNMDRQILRSLAPSVLFTTNRLTVWRYKHPRPAEIENCLVPQTLSSMNNLRTLLLVKCHNLPFILALNPKKNDSKLVLCPGLEELILYIKTRDQFHIKPLTSMAKERASRDAKLSSITIVGLDELVPGTDVFELREHVGHVEYRVDNVPPDWDIIPRESDDDSDDGGDGESN